MPLTPHTEGFGALLTESQQAGFRMLVRLTDEWANGANRFDQKGEMLLGAFSGSQLVGTGGRNVDPFAGDPQIGRLRHFYVADAFRGQGIGRLLVERMLKDAALYFARLHVRAPVTAFGFYQHLGFRRVEGIDTATLQLIL